ncbi:MAG: discoidin domain-containing protein, partial [Bacteroidaceae bacterium]|nr:discoidin domain-containing protein [Bacteroidaceae bacterium]
MKRYTFILALVMSMLSFTNSKADKLLIRYGESSIYAYQTYSIQNAFDGKYDTKFWSNGNPQAGYTFTVYLGSSAKVGDIKLYFDNGDLPSDGAVIEVNENNSGNWIQVGEPLNGVQANDVVTRNAGGVSTKHIRLRFTQPSA